MITHYKEKILSQSTAVRTAILSEVKEVVNSVVPDLTSVRPFKTDIKKWLKPVIDLSDFSVYPMNGITEGLNWWMQNSQYNIWRDAGDYQWVDLINGRMNPHTVYQSIPSAIDGNFKEVNGHQSVALDLAYVGSTIVKKIEINKNVKHVFFSLSKPFGLRNIRTGWYFSREPDSKLDSLISSAKYFNYYATDVAEKVISNFDIDYVYNSISTKQKAICNLLDFNPSDSVWLATTTNVDYKKFRRSGDVARISLSGVYDIC